MTQDTTFGFETAGSTIPNHNSNAIPSIKSKFDPSNYRKAGNVQMSQTVDSSRIVQTIIPVRKPSNKQFVRAHSSHEHQMDLPTVLDEKTGEIYLLAGNLELPFDVENKVDHLHLVTAITADGSLFLWFYKNSTNSWSDSARIAIREATKRWVRVIADKSSNGYKLETPMVAPPEPEWPKITPTEILERAFGSRYIDSLEHPQIKQLRGDFLV